jgi:hypothetical protein
MLMWLSFVKGGKFAGVVITDAADVGEASLKCWRLGANPGGEIMSFEIPEDAALERSYPRDVLLSEEFLKADGHKKIKDVPPEVQKALGFND